MIGLFKGDLGLCKETLQQKEGRGRRQEEGKEEEGEELKASKKEGERERD